MLSRNRRLYLLKVLLFFAAYYLTGIIGLKINAIHNFATLIWPPTGIALVALFMLGYRAWPVIMLAAFLVNFTVGAQPYIALGIAIGNTLEAIVAVYLLRRFVNFKSDLQRGRDVFGLVFYAAFLSTLVSASIGTTTLLLSDTIQIHQYRETWVAWWVGDMLGDLLIAPFILIWTERLKLKFNRDQILELLFASGLLVAVSIFVFRGYSWLGISENFPRYYLIYPPLIWVVLRFGRRGAVTASLAIAVMAIGTTIAGLQPLSEDEIGKNLIYVQGFIGVTAVTLLTIAAIVAERENTIAHQKNLERRAKILANQRNNLLALSQSKDEFVALTSHQLRTPVTAVKQYIGLLLEGYSDPLTTGQRMFLKRAYAENTRQLHIIEDLLLTTRLDLGKVALVSSTHDLGELVARAVASMKGKFEERHQKLIFNKPKTKYKVKFDPKYLGATIENLLDNAANYSEDGTKTQVSIKRVNKNIEIIVKDEGVGIDPADYSKLFQKFSRIPNKLSDTVNGTGLGLYFSLKIVELHGGKIKVDSALQKGSRFTIILPI